MVCGGRWEDWIERGQILRPGARCEEITIIQVESNNCWNSGSDRVSGEEWKMEKENWWNHRRVGVEKTARARCLGEHLGRRVSEKYVFFPSIPGSAADQLWDPAKPQFSSAEPQFPCLKWRHSMRTVVSEPFRGDLGIQGHFSGEDRGNGRVRSGCSVCNGLELGSVVRIQCSKSKTYLTRTSPLHNRISCKIKLDF